MKYIKILISIYILCLLVACNSNEQDQLTLPNDEMGEEEFIIPDPVGIVRESITDDGLIEALEGLERLPYLTRISEGELLKLATMDLVTGDILATYELAEDEGISFSKRLDNGYFVVRMADRFWQEEESEFPFIIFAENLVPLETIWFEGDVLPFWMEIVKIVDGQLYIYGWGWSGGWDDLEDWILVNIEFLRVNIHTGEVEVLFEHGSEMQSYILHQFINETQILTSALTTNEATGEFSTSVGILDLELGELVDEFELDHFDILSPDSQGSRILLSESRIAPGRERNEVLVFDIDSRTHKMVSLGFSEENLFQESFWARLSLDGDHIVTVNEAESIFRKYNMEGGVVAEVEIEIPVFDYYGFEVENNFEIFPISDFIYAIHIVHQLGRHIQIVNLP